MRAPSHAYRGFTLIELLATIIIVAILAAVAFPSVIAANPFAERGYADAVAANLRRARDIAMTTGCDVRFTIDGTGYNAMQRAAAGTDCATAGNWTRTVLNGPAPAEVVLATARQFVFAAGDGRVGAVFTIDLGARQIMVEESGLVSGP